MRLLLLTALTMTAFAANSVLNRMALADGLADAGSFATLRLIAGALMLAALVWWRGRGWSRGGRGARAMAGAVAALLLYLYAFSAAYARLDAGLGALILFGVVQVTMFAAGLLRAEPTPPRRWIGAALAFAGLAWLLWPAGGPQVSPVHGAAMAAAGLGWGLYSLAGHGATDALGATAANFVLAVPAGLAAWAGLMIADVVPMPSMVPAGAALAVLSGAVMSGLGYALWYTVLPRLPRAVAAVVQLTVPVIAMTGGAVLLAERPGLPALLAAALVLGGVGVSVLPARGAARNAARATVPGQMTSGSSGS